MSNWKEVVEEGQVFFVNEELGNIAKVGDTYIAMMPMVVRLGPFTNLEQAKEALANMDGVKGAIDQYNMSLLRK